MDKLSKLPRESDFEAMVNAYSKVSAMPIQAVPYTGNNNSFGNRLDNSALAPLMKLFSFYFEISEYLKVAYSRTASREVREIIMQAGKEAEAAATKLSDKYVMLCGKKPETVVKVNGKLSYADLIRQAVYSSFKAISALGLYNSSIKGFRLSIHINYSKIHLLLLTLLAF
jgi:hypothetical protein